MTRAAWLMTGVVVLAGCGGPDAVGLAGADDGIDDVEVLEGALTATSRAATWLPMQEGNRWVFTSASGQRQVTLTSVGGGRGLLTGLYAQPVWVGLASADAPTLSRWNGAAWGPLVRFGYARTSWTVGEGPCNRFTARRSATGERVVGPAGDFSDTRTIAFDIKPDPTARCVAPDIAALTFASRVGLVAFETGRNERFVLSSARVNGVSLPSAATAATLSLDAAVYRSTPNTIACVTAPCPSSAKTAVAKVRFVVRNTSVAAQTYRFTSGCLFDLEVVAASGRTVARLSERQLCTLALTDVVLAAGAARVFETDFTLEDASGLQLDGDFTLRASLTASGGAPGSAPSASAPLSVRVVR